MFPFGLLSGEVVSINGGSNRYTITQPIDGGFAYNTLIISGVNVPAQGVLQGYVMTRSYEFGATPYADAEILESWVWGTNFTKTYWVRVGLVSGDAPQSGSGMSRVWREMSPGSGFHFYRWETTDETLVEGTVLVELSDDVTDTIDEDATVISSAEYTIGVVAELP